MEFVSTLCGVLCFLCILAAPITLIVWLVLLITKNEKKKKAKYVFLSMLGGIVLFTIIGVATFQECEHNWETIENVTATCTDSGRTVVACSLCDSEETTTIPATGHSFTEEIIEVATCSATGMTKKTCSICNKIEEIVIDKVEHTYEYATTKAPSLEENGIETGTCSVCGDIKEIEISKLGTKANPGIVTVKELVADIDKDIDAAKAKYNGKWIKITGKVTQVVDGGIMTGYYIYGKRGDNGLRIVCWRDGDIFSGSVVGNTYTFLGQVREITTFNATEIGDCTIIED